MGGGRPGFVEAPIERHGTARLLTTRLFEHELVALRLQQLPPLDELFERAHGSEIVLDGRLTEPGASIDLPRAEPMVRLPRATRARRKQLRLRDERLQVIDRRRTWATELRVRSVLCLGENLEHLPPQLVAKAIVTMAHTAERRGSDEGRVAIQLVAILVQ